MDDLTVLYSSVLPIRSIVVTLKFTDDARPRFFHQIELSSLLRYWLPGDIVFEQHFRIDCPEAGQTNYQNGDYYRFTLIALGNCEAHIETLIKRLKALPSSAPVIDQKAAFRNNMVLHSLQDGFDESPIKKTHELTCYDERSLQQEASLWQQNQNLRMRWISPVRLLKEKSQRIDLKGESRFCRDQSDTSIELILSRLHDRFAGFNRGKTPTSAILRVEPPAAETRYSHLFWLDNHYTDANAKSQVIGGMSGLIEFGFKHAETVTYIWQMLVLGQFVGVGQRTSFGYGRYVLETLDGDSTYLRCLPAQSLLMRAGDTDNIKSAYRHILKNASNHQHDEDDIEFDDDDSGIVERIQTKLKKIQQQQYQLPELKGIIIDKPSGGFRALAVPPFNDRILQRTLAQVMTHTLEKLFYRHSYGFRPGRSRINAKSAIQRAWRAGYRWVYESDIEDFFDSVNLCRLKERLVSLYGNDPAIQAIINWMSAPVRFEGELIQRKNGLPQGSPLSPMLANLMLDDFDSDMRDAGFMLIRYADDFVVLCKDKAQAQAADSIARESLAEHGFSLNQSKTHIKTMEQGFKYLGYLFVNDMALDVGATKSKQPKPAKSAQSWLANISSKPAHKITQENANQLTDQSRAERNQQQVGERDKHGTLICVTGINALISTSAQQIRVHRDDKLLYNLPWRSLQAVILFGNHHITTPAMHAALKQQVPIHFASGGGRYRGTLWNAQPATHSYELWLKQAEAFKNPDNALYAAKQIVKARLIHIKETLRQRGISTGTTNIDRSIQRLHVCKSLSELNGKEGSISKEYFQFLKKIIPPEFKFKGRNRRPPLDPFNALLSLGYTLLHGYTESILRASGLLPWAGFYHQKRGRHAALASDLMEPFRHLVERTALTMLNQHSLKLEDFSYTQDGACQLTNAARRNYLAALTQRLEAQVKARGQAEPKRVSTHMHQQCLSLVDWIVYGEPFNAWRTR